MLFSSGGDTIVTVVGPWESCNSGSPVLCVDCIEEPKASPHGIILITSVVFGVLFQDVWIYQGELSQVSLWPSHLLRSHSRKSNVLRECCKHSPQRKTRSYSVNATNCFKFPLVWKQFSLSLLAFLPPGASESRLVKAKAFLASERWSWAQRMATHCTSSCTDKSQAVMASTGMNWLICVMEVRCWHTQAVKELGLLRGLSPGSRFSEFCPYQLGLILVQHSMGRRTSGTPPTGHPVFISGNYK